jgi:caffeoyl-CoA O-methyltransferase
MKDYAAQIPGLSDYLDQTFHPEDAVLRRIREFCKERGLPPIHVGAMDGLHLELLIRASGAKKAVEVGTLGGYSGTCIARGLGEGGKLWTLEIDRKHAQVARENFDRAGVGSQIEILVGPGVEGLKKIADHGPFDVIFIDADKVNYPNYLKWAADNLRIGGLVLGDNTFAFGMIAMKPETVEDPDDRVTVSALRQFNADAATGGRFRATLLPTGEGLTVAVKVR